MRTLIILLLLFLMLPVASVQAWPAYAERVVQPCSTCHLPGFSGLGPFGEAFRQEGYRWPGVDEPPADVGERLIILGLSVMLWNGIFAGFFIAAALAAVYLQRRYKKIARGRWHHRLALTGSVFALIHIILGVLQRFFGIVLI